VMLPLSPTVTDETVPLRSTGPFDAVPLTDIDPRPLAADTLMVTESEVDVAARVMLVSVGVEQLVTRNGLVSESDSSVTEPPEVVAPPSPAAAVVVVESGAVVVEPDAAVVVVASAVVLVVEASSVVVVSSAVTASVVVLVSSPSLLPPLEQAAVPRTTTAARASRVRAVRVTVGPISPGGRGAANATAATLPCSGRAARTEKLRCRARVTAASLLQPSGDQRL
jgi:hypothetical protein